jgi:hypothetical protein
MRSVAINLRLDVDDGTPRAALDVAGQAVRAFNHRSATRFDPCRDGWQYPSDAYRALGELIYLTGALPQVFGHIASSLLAQLEQGHIEIDYGTAYAGNPKAAVAAESVALERSNRPPGSCTGRWVTHRTPSALPATQAQTCRNEPAPRNPLATAHCAPAITRELGLNAHEHPHCGLRR